MRLSVLGSHGTWPGTAGECSGYLVTSGSFHLWLDAGTGTFARLQEHVPPSDIDAVLITHGHADHFLDVIPAFYARHYGDLGEPGLPFYSPTGFMDLAALLVSENGRNVMAEAYAFDHLEAGRVVEVGPFRVTSFEMTHIGVYSLGYRIQAEGHTLAYTGDTGPCEEAIELARGADLFLCEATYQDPMDHTFFHLSAEQAAEHAARAGVRRLVLTHLTRYGRHPAAAARGHLGDAARRTPQIGGLRPGCGEEPRRDARCRLGGRKVTRPDGRASGELRPVTYELGYQEWANGSVLFSMGKTRVLCAATVSEDLPRWLRGTGRGWVTGEYSMLPASTLERSGREVNRGRPGGRTQEIQRLIGRALRSVTDLERLGERTVTVDCDVPAPPGPPRASGCAPHPVLAAGRRPPRAPGPPARG